MLTQLNSQPFSDQRTGYFLCSLFFFPSLSLSLSLFRRYSNGAAGLRVVGLLRYSFFLSESIGVLFLLSSRFLLSEPDKLLKV
ncbi:MAG: hypothetical protein JOS17DRAFT_748341 [Linnemannia elongata]|nr:MAG: hypothetical protein JOS17DRAFT_748341 [Linnemannia elongata]